MGLFTKKDPCAICGGKVKGLFPWKIEGKLICKECFGKTDLPVGTEGKMTLEEFCAYRAFREQNQQLAAQFQITRSVDMISMGEKIVFDEGKGLLCLSKDLDQTIFEGNQILSVTVKEDDALLLECNRNEIVYYDNSVMEQMMQMAPKIEEFLRDVEVYEGIKKRREEIGQTFDRPRPQLEVKEPFRNFKLEIQFEHPYWEKKEFLLSGPSLNRMNPNLEFYLRKYRRDVATVKELAQGFQAVSFPGAAERNEKGTAAPYAWTEREDPVQAIQRYHKLMEQGIITNSEFEEKKRQLMRI